MRDRIYRALVQVQHLDTENSDYEVLSFCWNRSNCWLDKRHYSNTITRLGKLYPQFNARGFYDRACTAMKKLAVTNGLDIGLGIPKPQLGILDAPVFPLVKPDEKVKHIYYSISFLGQYIEDLSTLSDAVKYAAKFCKDRSDAQYITINAWDMEDICYAVDQDSYMSELLLLIDLFGTKEESVIEKVAKKVSQERNIKKHKDAVLYELPDYSDNILELNRYQLSVLLRDLDKDILIALQRAFKISLKCKRLETIAERLEPSNFTRSTFNSAIRFLTDARNYHNSEF